MQMAAAETIRDNLALTSVPTFGCIYCGRNTGCYKCGGHGVIGSYYKNIEASQLDTCATCLSACTACAFMRNVMLNLVVGGK